MAFFFCALEFYIALVAHISLLFSEVVLVACHDGAPFGHKPFRQVLGQCKFSFSILNPKNRNRSRVSRD